MKTGLESLDAGAPDITYSGNEGPKSPQDDQQKMAEFQLQEYMEEFERVFPDMKDQRGTPDYMKELQDYFEGLASKQEEGIGDMAMKSGLIDEYRNYKMGQEEAGEQFMLPRDYYRSQEQDRMGVKEGGSMDFAMQGGVKNYLGEQEIVSGVPVKWQSGPGKPDTELAYITKAEKDLLLKEDIHGSLQDGPNMGPGGIMSLDSFGDIGGAGASGGDTEAGGGAMEGRGFSGRNTNTTSEREFDRQKANQRAALQIAERKQAKDLGYKERENIATMDRPGALENKLGFNVLDFIPGIGMARRLASMFGPLDNKAFFTEKVLTSKNPQGYTEDDYEDYMAARMAGTIDAYGNQIQQGGGGSLDINNNQNQLLLNTNLTGTDTDSDTDVANLYRGDQFLRRDNQLALAADGGRIGYADGGITDLRQGYFLGKLVKKATRGIKKIFKSPIGKAALLGFGGYKAGLFGNPFTSDFAKKIGGKLFLDKGTNALAKGAFSMANVDPFKIGILGASALTGLMAKNSEDDEQSLDDYMRTANRGPSIDPRGIRQMIAANKGNINPQDFAFLNPAYYQNAADGGRIGLAAGGIGNLRGALSKQMFGYDDDEDDIKKLAFGGSAGMPPVTMQTEGQNIQSFPDDESMPMAQGPQNPMPMKQPMMNPMMDPRMMQQMMMAKQQGGQNRMMAAMGGRMGYGFGKKVSAMMTPNDDSVEAGSSSGLGGMIVNMIRENPNMFKTSKMMLDRDGDGIDDRTQLNNNRFFAAMGGRMGYAEGGESELLDMGGLEKDYRNDGGFVPMGEYERKDDVPARLSKNEFVFTADAVRNAGGGDIDKGAEIMENMMNNLEQGGQVSEESQGLRGAREMFQTQQRLGEVL